MHRVPCVIGHGAALAERRDGLPHDGVLADIEVVPISEDLESLARRSRQVGPNEQRRLEECPGRGVLGLVEGQAARRRALVGVADLEHVEDQEFLILAN